MSKFDPKCMKCNNPVADVKVSISMRGQPISEFTGYLCSKCRVIYSETKIEGIPLRMFM